ncbi:chemotaxis protein CheW [Clostridium oryzae]|uniref:Chemotaxis protein CheW n=1 Tax=Clostridium oryzae TaxID=1450648 RepID=A0A1V4ILF3_9CLOT|nr:chemotaxis protein CheW [Clostridium oryzae]OPJ60868.1 chemotaxis protein CheW [Clostridium oryzae]
MQIIVFDLNDEQFAVETSKVQSINDAMVITKVPKAPKYIKGLINLRGNVISLLDIEVLLDTHTSDKPKESVIILDMKDELVGIAVDNVSEVLEIEDKKIEKVQDEKNKSYIKGVINFSDKIVTFIDIDGFNLN